MSTNTNSTTDSDQTSTTNIADPSEQLKQNRRAALAELNLCLRRYEALCAPPRPVRDFDRMYVQWDAVVHPLTGLDFNTHMQLCYQAIREWHRFGDFRSADAWAALELRMWAARQNAIELRVMLPVGEEFTLFSDRMVQVSRRRDQARHLEASSTATARA